MSWFGQPKVMIYNEIHRRDIKTVTLFSMAQRCCWSATRLSLTADLNNGYDSRILYDSHYRQMAVDIAIGSLQTGYALAVSIPPAVPRPLHRPAIVRTNCNGIKSKMKWRSSRRPTNWKHNREFRLISIATCWLFIIRFCSFCYENFALADSSVVFYIIPIYFYVSQRILFGGFFILFLFIAAFVLDSAHRFSQRTNYASFT